MLKGPGMMKLFRLVALVEGVTTIALFFVAMPMKHLLRNPVLIPRRAWRMDWPSSSMSWS